MCVCVFCVRTDVYKNTCTQYLLNTLFVDEFFYNHFVSDVPTVEVSKAGPGGGFCIAV